LIADELVARSEEKLDHKRILELLALFFGFFFSIFDFLCTFLLLLTRGITTYGIRHGFGVSEGLLFPEISMAFRGPGFPEA
jgi:hypothetical protein